MLVSRVMTAKKYTKKVLHVEQVVVCLIDLSKAKSKAPVNKF